LRYDNDNNVKISTNEKDVREIKNKKFIRKDYLVIYVLRETYHRERKTIIT